MKDILKKLADSGAVLVAGSYARGEQNSSSDIDFLIKTPRESIVYGVRNKNIDIIIKIMQKKCPGKLTNRGTQIQLNQISIMKTGQRYAIKLPKSIKY
jgi:hypothetical protein